MNLHVDQSINLPFLLSWLKWPVRINNTNSFGEPAHLMEEINVYFEMQQSKNY